MMVAGTGAVLAAADTLLAAAVVVPVVGGMAVAVETDVTVVAVEVDRPGKTKIVTVVAQKRDS
jgi:hypothetical protein